MAHYFRFIICMSLGLFGVCIVLKTLMDTVWLNWDVQRDMRRFFKNARRYRSPLIAMNSQGRVAASNTQDRFLPPVATPEIQLPAPVVSQPPVLQNR